MLPEIMRDEVFRLETRRMWLRWPRAKDAAAIAAMVGDAAVASMTSHIPHPYPDGAAILHVMRARASNEAGTSAIFALTRKGWPDTPLGMIGLHVKDGDGLSVGYYVGRAHWGRGLATEALQAVAAAVFLFTRASSIAAGAMAVNTASRRVQEKCGFVYTGSAMEHFPARDAMIAVDHLGLTRERWARLTRGGGVHAVSSNDAAQGTVGSACL